MELAQEDEVHFAFSATKWFHYLDAARRKSKMRTSEEYFMFFLIYPGSSTQQISSCTDTYLPPFKLSKKDE